MDSTSLAIVIVIALLVLVVIASFIVFRKQAKVKINTPLGNLELDASNRTPAAPKPGISIEDAEAGGGILAEDNNGGGVGIKRVKVADDIIATSGSPKKK